MFLAVAPLLAAEPQTADEAQQMISLEKQREASAKASIAGLQAEVADIRTKVESARTWNSELSRQVYSKLGLQPQDVEAYLQQLSAFAAQVGGFQTLYGPDLKGWEAAVVWAEYQMKQFQANQAAKLGRSAALMELAGNNVVNSRNALEAQKAKPIVVEVAPVVAPVVAPEPQVQPVAKPEPMKPEPKKVEAKKVEAKSAPRTFDPTQKTYTTGVYSDHKDGSLWEISKIVYGDPGLWQRIWRANRDQISDPDLITPGLTLVIPTEYVPPEGAVSP